MAALPRQSATSGKVTLRVEPSRVAGSAICTVSIPLKVNGDVLRALRCGAGAPASADRCDETIVAYAAARKAAAKLGADPKARVVCCGCPGDEFQVSADCAPTLSSVRKAAAAIISAMAFGGLNKFYSQAARTIGVTPEKGAFDKAARAAHAALASGVTVVFSGKVRVADSGSSTGAAKAKAAAEVLERKHAAAVKKTPAAGSARKSPCKTEGEACAVKRAGGLKAAVASAYAMEKLGLRICVCDGGVCVPRSAAATLARDAASAPAVASFAKRVLRPKAEAKGVLVADAAARCAAPAAALRVDGEAVTVAWVKSAVAALA